MDTTRQASSHIAAHLCDAYDYLSNNKTAILSSAEAYFYKKAAEYPKRIDDLVAAIAVNIFRLIQPLFSAASTVVAISSVKQIADNLEGPRLQLFYSTFLGSYLPFAALSAIIFGSSYALVNKNMSRFGKTKSQKIASTIQVATIINSIALAFLTDKKISMTLRAFLSAYSLGKNNEITFYNGNFEPDIDDQKISLERGFEKFYASYNTVQATLSLLQHVPELAPIIVPFKHGFKTLDVILGSIATLKYFFTSILENESCIVPLILTPLVTIPIFFGFHNVFSRKESLDNLATKDISAVWSLPHIEAMHCFFNSFRLAVSAGTVLCLPNKRVNLISLITQAIDLGGTISLPWVRIEQTFKDVKFYTFALLPSIENEKMRLAIAKVTDMQIEIYSNTTWWFGRAFDVRGNFKYIEITFELPKVQNIREYASMVYIWNMGHSYILIAFITMLAEAMLKPPSDY